MTAKDAAATLKRPEKPHEASGAQVARKIALPG